MRSSDFGSIVSPLGLGAKKRPPKNRYGTRGPRVPRATAMPKNPTGALSQARMKRKLMPRMPGVLSQGRR